MDVRRLLEDLDETILFADIIGAAEKYFDEDVRVMYGNELLKGKGKRLRTLHHFMDSIDHVNSIQLHQQAVDNDESHSLFTFDFTKNDGANLVWYEIIRRRWENDKVVEEEYILYPSAAEVKRLFSGTNGRKKSGRSTSSADDAAASKKGSRGTKSASGGNEQTATSTGQGRRKPGPKKGGGKATGRKKSPGRPAGSG